MLLQPVAMEHPHVRRLLYVGPDPHLQGLIADTDFLHPVSSIPGLRDIAFELFFSRNSWRLDTNYRYRRGVLGGEWRWLRRWPRYFLEHLNNFELSFEIRPGVGTRRINSLVIPTLRVMGRSRYLTRMTLNINITGMDRAYRNGEFRCGVFPHLGRFRGIRDLTINFSEPWPRAEAWLRARMSRRRPEEGHNNNHILPAMRQMFPSTVGQIMRMDETELIRWASALGLEEDHWRAMDQRVLAQHIHEFMAEDARDNGAPTQDSVSLAVQRTAYQNVKQEQKVKAGQEEKQNVKDEQDDAMEE